MPTGPANYMRDIHLILTSMRPSLGRPGKNWDQVTAILLQIERSRLGIQPLLDLDRGFPGMSADKKHLLLVNLKTDLLQLGQMLKAAHLGARGFRLNPIPSGVGRGLLERIPDLRDYRIEQAVDLLIDMTETADEQHRDLFTTEATPGARPTGLAALKALLPGQKLAPVQFAVSKNRLVVSRRPSRSDPADVANIQAARQEIVAGGDRILAELQRSNCDRRLIEHLSYLQGQISTEENIVKIGICNIGCETMRDAFKQELPEAVDAMLRAHTRTIELFAGQFPEWNRFIENAAVVGMTTEDVRAVRDATHGIVRDLSARPEIVDPEVPRTLSRLNAILENPSAASKRAAFAVLRSIENFVSSIFQYGLRFLEKTADKAIDGLSSVAAKAVIIGLLSLALGGATGIGGVAGKIGEMAWLGNAAELVQSQIQKMMHP